MRITYSYQGKKSFKDFETSQVIIGRPIEAVTIDLDLTPDTMVSRPHARIWIEYGHYWIEDLNSTRGTRVNGEEIRGKGRQRLHARDAVAIGETTLRVDVPVEQEDSVKTLPPEEPESELVKGITQSLDAAEPAFPQAEADTDTDQRLALFYELPLRFGEETRLDALLQLIIERVVDVIPGARRGTLLVKDRPTGELLWKASLPADNPSVSITLAKRAMRRREAFIWSRSAPPVEDDKDAAEKVPSSAFEHNIESAIYAPLLWKGEPLGVMCVDNCETCDSFRTDDLRLLRAFAHHATVSIVNLHLQEDLRLEIRALNKFMKLVSPQVAERLRDHREQIHLGGEFRDATILFSDIRGFTKLSAQMEPDDVTEMLEDYFGRLVPVIFEHKGTVDKFVGDAIVAVFGSPREDGQQQFHAIQAALEMQSVMREVNARRNSRGKHTGELGIGINCGEVVHGFIGSDERMEFTVIGDVVNRASRLCDGASGGEVLISPEMYQWVFKNIEVEQATIPTKHEGNLTVYRVKSIKQ